MLTFKNPKFEKKNLAKNWNILTLKNLKNPNFDLKTPKFDTFWPEK